MQHRRSNNTRSFLAAVALVVMTAFLFLALAPTEAAPAAEEAATAEWEVVAMELANPRGLIFGPDGALYVAEGGAGGDGVCIPDPEGGNRCFGETGAITKVTFDADMNPTDQEQVITGIGSIAHEDRGSVTAGPTDVAFQGDDLYFTTGFGGDPADLLPAGPLGADGAHFAKIMAAGPGDSFSAWSDMGAFESAENPDEDLPDSNPFDLLALPSEVRAPTADAFLAIDAGGNTLLAVSETGDLSVVAVWAETLVEFPPGTGSMMPMDPVPTSVAIGPDGAYYVTQLTGFPFPVGGASVWRVEPGGDPEKYAEGFTNILDLAFAADDSLYVLEMFTNSLLSNDPTGAIIRIDADGGRTLVAREGLVTPTAMTIGPDHALYVSNFSLVPEGGQIVRIPTKLSEAEHFAAFMSGAEENPPVDTDATGIALFHLADDGTLSWDISVSDIEDITAAHIHLGAVGVNGPPVITLYDGTGDFDPDNPISGSAVLTPEQIDTLLAGDYYVNVHTSTNPGGEIRGQIVVLQRLHLPLVVR